MSEARTMLEQLEASTDWQALVALALADPPAPELLHYHLSIWHAVFSAAYGGPAADPSDLPAPVGAFLAKINAVARRGGRPRCDEAQALAAARAWLRVSLHKEYVHRRDVIKALRGVAGTTFGFDKASTRGDRPSRLALDSLSKESGLKPRRLEDLAGIRKPKQ